MATAREIKRRIRSIKNISKVTGALEAVSASKVRRAQNQALASRAYTEAAYEMLREMAVYESSDIAHPLLEERENKRKSLIILITSDRGLAGPYNSNITRRAVAFAQKLPTQVEYLTIGYKGRDTLLRRGDHIVAEFPGVPGTPSILDIAAINRVALDDFLVGGYDEVYVAFTRFINTLNQQPVVERLLPLRPRPEDVERAREQVGGMHAVLAFEPNIEAVLEEVLPRFTEVLLFQAVVEALASEHSARMVAMRNATENANALVDDLTLRFNKARQLAITSEMLDIVGGAEALQQSSS